MSIMYISSIVLLFIFIYSFIKQFSIVKVLCGHCKDIFSPLQFNVCVLVVVTLFLRLHPVIFTILSLMISVFIIFSLLDFDMLKSC